MHANRAVFVLGLLALAAPVAAQDVRPESIRMFGGTYSTDCHSPAAPKPRITSQALVIEHGARRKASGGVMDSHTSFGAAPTSPTSLIPPGYVMEFIGDEFSFHVFEDKAGYYIQPSGYLPAAEPMIGKANMKSGFRRCADRGK